MSWGGRDIVHIGSTCGHVESVVVVFEVSGHVRTRMRQGGPRSETCLRSMVGWSTRAGALGRLMLPCEPRKHKHCVAPLAFSHVCSRPICATLISDYLRGVVFAIAYYWGLRPQGRPKPPPAGAVAPNDRLVGADLLAATPASPPFARPGDIRLASLYCCTLYLQGYLLAD